MTAAELVALLATYPADADVLLDDGEWGPCPIIGVAWDGDADGVVLTWGNP